MWLCVAFALSVMFSGRGLGCPDKCICWRDGHVNCVDQRLQGVPLGLPAATVNLDLSWNSIAGIPARTFENLTQLRYLYLQGNEISHISGDALLAIPSIQELWLSENQLQDFPWAVLPRLPSLLRLDLQNNRLAHVPSGDLPTFPALTWINLAYNEITSIEGGFLASQPALETAAVHNNPFSCNCSLQSFREWLDTTKVSVPNNADIVCDTPRHLKGRNVMAVPIGALTCRPPTVSVYPTNINVLSGHTTVMLCNTTGDPDPEVEWILPMGAVISAASKTRRIRVLDDGSLLLSPVRQTDAGTYTCIATNQEGRANATATMNVTRADCAGPNCRSIASDTVPVRIFVTSVTSNSALIQWFPLVDEPDLLTLDTYRVLYYRVGESLQQTAVLKHGASLYRMKNLKPSSRYSVCVTQSLLPQGDHCVEFRTEDAELTHTYITIGYTLGSVVLLLLIATVVYCYMRCYRRKRRDVFQRSMNAVNMSNNHATIQRAENGTAIHMNGHG
ncbi:peroxidasin homolog [Branchiostoma floridae x Branchiostoma japonicum]